MSWSGTTEKIERQPRIGCAELRRRQNSGRRGHGATWSCRARFGVVGEFRGSTSSPLAQVAFRPSLDPADRIRLET